MQRGTFPHNEAECLVNNTPCMEERAKVSVDRSPVKHAVGQALYFITLLVNQFKIITSFFFLVF